MYLNKVQLIGNITREPELKVLQSGTKLLTFSIATNKKWSNDGEKKEVTEYHNIVAMGKNAEIINEYSKIGDSIYIEGSLQTRSWESEGRKVFRTEISVDNFQFNKNETTNA